MVESQAARYELIAQRKIMYLQVTQSLIHFDKQEFVILDDKEIEKAMLDQSQIGNGFNGKDDLNESRINQQAMDRSEIHQNLDESKIQLIKRVRDNNRPSINNRIRQGDKVNYHPPKSNQNQKQQVILRKDSIDCLLLEEYDIIKDPNEEISQSLAVSPPQNKNMQSNNKNKQESQIKVSPSQFELIQVEEPSEKSQENGNLWGPLNFLENYQNQLSSQDFVTALNNKQFDFRTNPKLKYLDDQIRSSLTSGPHELTQEGRTAAWQLFLNIDKQSEEFKVHLELFNSLVCEKPEPNSAQEKVENLLMKDVHRTFSSLKLFTQDPKKGENKLFNVLKVYSIYDIDIGYVQGMSFVAAMILIQLNHDQELAWVVFMKVMQIDEWRRLYTQQTPKLFELTKFVRDFIIKEYPTLNSLLVQHTIILESLFASPFFTLFSNLIPLDQAVKILDRFILDGEIVIVDIMKNLIERNYSQMLQKDCWELQEFLGRKMYEQALVNNIFTPLQSIFNQNQKDI